MEDIFLPPGFRFHPTDEELITHYLSKKVSDFGFCAKAVADVDLNKCEPWDLPAKASMGEKEWYFFGLRDRKYPTGLRTNRATEAGYWKTTGKDKEILRQSGLLVGMKKTLVFYKGRAPKGKKSNWVMHEYRLENDHSIKPTKEEWVICRVFQKTKIVKKLHSLPSDEQSPDSPCDANSILHNQFGDVERMPNLIEDSTNVLPIKFANNISTQIQRLSPLNWPSLIGKPVPTLSPHSPLLTSNMAVNSLLPKALHLKSYQQQHLSSSNEYALIPNTAVLPNQQFEGEHLGLLNFHAMSPISSSKVNLEEEEEEQPFSWTPFSENMYCRNY